MSYGQELEELELRGHLRAIQKMDMLMARESLLHLILACKPDYRVSFHHWLVCERLSRIIEEPGQRLIVTLPPQYGKSEIVSRFLPAWVLGRCPWGKIILASYAAALSHGFNRDCQRIMSTEVYQKIFPKTRIGPDKKLRLKRTEELVETSEGGYLYTVGVGGATTGKTADPLLVVDDPFKDLAEAMNPNHRQKVKDWYGAVAQTRVSKRATIIIMHTRWHDDDLAGHLLETARKDPDATQWEVINFPALSDKRKELHPEDPRGKSEALWDFKSNAKELARIRVDVGSIIWEALYQQRPRLEGGNLLNSKWWRYYKRADLPHEADFEEWCLSMDCTFKDLDTSDFVVIQAWARKGSNKYLIDQVRGRWDILKTIENLARMAVKYKRAHAKIIEEKANGASVIQLLKSELSGMLPVSPKDSKIARVVAASPQAEAGNVYLPSPDEAPWVNDFVDECSAFPRGAHDDQVDCFTQAIDRLSRNEHSYLRRLLKKD